MFSTAVARMSRALARTGRIAPLVVAIVGAGFVAGACDVHGLSEPGTLSTLSVSPDPQSMAVNGTQQFTATGKDFSGAIVVSNPTWSVVAGGGTISPSGFFTAGTTTGTFASTVKASSGSLSATATIIVTVGPLASITVTPNPDTTQAGATRQFVAVGRDAGGNAVPLTPVWSVANGGGTIQPSSGLFVAGSSTGTYANTVKATSGTVSGTATVVVTSPTGPLSPTSIDLRSTASNGIMAGTAVTCVTGGIINADISISPGNTLTGFGPCSYTGTLNSANATAANAQLDLTRLYNTLKGLPCPPANVISANLGGTTKAAGVYCAGTGIGATGVVTLDGGGDPNAVFVFQAGTELTTAGDVVLINGANARNVYWVVGSSATIGTASQWKGNIVALTSITLVDNATLLGRALARNGAVSLGTNNVITLP